MASEQQPAASWGADTDGRLNQPSEHLTDYAMWAKDASGNVTGLVGPDGNGYAATTVTVAPSGDVTGVTDAENINAALADYFVVALKGDADYYVNSSLIIDGLYTIPGYGVSGNSLYGDGIGSTRIHQVGSNFPVIKKANRSANNNAIACNIKGLTLLGADASGADSCGIFSEATAGGNYFDDIFIQGFKAGIRFNDNTLTGVKNVQIRNCGIGVQFGWQADIIFFQNCRIQECTTAGIANGWTDATHHSGAVTSNSNIKFHTCRFGKNTVSADWNDYDSTNLVLDTCYFEDETKLMWLGSAAITTSTPKKCVFTDCHIEYPTVVPSGALIEMRNPYTANSDISLIRTQCQYTLGSGVRYLKAGLNSSILIDECILPHTNGHIDYYTGAAQHYDITIGNTGSAFPTVHWSANVQHVNYFDGATLSGTVPAAVMQMTGGTDKMFQKWERIAANTGAVVNTNNPSIIDVSGKWVLYRGAVQIQTPDSLPTAGSGYRGVMAYQSGGAGVADTIVCCMKSAADAYSWKVVATG